MHAVAAHVPHDSPSGGVSGIQRFTMQAVAVMGYCCVAGISGFFRKCLAVHRAALSRAVVTF